MSMAELHLALLASGPRHGYEIKREYDEWFPDARPLAYGQVYATLSRLERDGLAEVVDTRTEGGPERTVYAVTDAGLRRLESWLADPAGPAVDGGEDIVRKTVVALRATRPGQAPGSARDVVLRQRTAHLRRMRALQDTAGPGGPTGALASHLARQHTLLHLDADLRWLDQALDALDPAHGTAARADAPATSTPPPTETMENTR